MPVEQQHLLLLHGAWATPDVWSRVQPLFEQRGYQVHAVDLASTEQQPLDEDGMVQRVEAALLPLQGRITVVAHSGSGVVATLLGERHPDRITALIHVAGMMLPDGMHYGELVVSLLDVHPEAVGITPHLHWNADHSCSWVPAAVAEQIFFQDLPPAQARQLAGALVPQPESARALTARRTAAGCGRIPHLYIEARQDRSVILPVQREMQRLVPEAQVVSMDTGHAPHLACPDAFVKIVDEFIASIPEAATAMTLERGD